jgi:hypothetical protein
LSFSSSFLGAASGHVGGLAPVPTSEHENGFAFSLHATRNQLTMFLSRPLRTSISLARVPKLNLNKFMLCIPVAGAVVLWLHNRRAEHRPTRAEQNDSIDFNSSSISFVVVFRALFV